MFSNSNILIRARDNPPHFREYGHQVHFGLNIWTGVVCNTVMESSLLPKGLIAAWYFNILEIVLPWLLEDVLLVRQKVCFQHDGHLTHGNMPGSGWMRHIQEEWIGRGDPLTNLTAGFFVRTYLKEQVNTVPPRTIDYLVAKFGKLWQGQTSTYWGVVERMSCGAISSALRWMWPASKICSNNDAHMISLSDTLRPLTVMHISKTKRLLTSMWQNIFDLIFNTQYGQPVREFVFILYFWLL